MSLSLTASPPPQLLSGSGPGRICGAAGAGPPPPCRQLAPARVDSRRDPHDPGPLVEVDGDQVGEQLTAALALPQSLLKHPAADPLVARDGGREGRNPVVDEIERAVGAAA